MFKSDLTGKIESVYCKNFVTYTECSFHPTEYLNVIIGPNGTGKSTLVAAIIIGLGGDHKLLSRAQDIKSYIKNNENEAVVKVNIYTSSRGKITCFQRNFNNDGKSEFKVDGELLTRNKFLTLVANYKIQVSNLCQFLPQDRVQDFAKMNHQELFRNTLISSCSMEMIEQFTQLKELQKTRTQGKTSLEANRKKLEDAIARAEELQQKLQVYQARKEYTDKLDVCNAKIAWLALDALKIKLRENETDLKSAQRALDEQKVKSADILKQQKQIQHKTELYMKDIEKKEQTVLQLMTKEKSIAENIDGLNKKIYESKMNLEKEKREFAERQQELQREGDMLKLTIHDICKAKAQLQSDIESHAMEDCDKKITKIKSEESQYKKALGEICENLDGITPEVEMLKRRLERLKNSKEQGLQLLKMKYPNEYEIVQWLRKQDNKSSIFRGKIYEPMILELSLSDANNAKYLENTIPERDLLAFTCEEKADCSRLQSEAIAKNLKINIVHSASANECLYTPPEPIENYRKYGFNAYLLDLVHGPAAILNYLCSLYHIHSIPIGNDNVGAHTDHIRKTLYFGGDQRYQVSISKYSKQSSIMQSTIRSRRLFTSVSEQDLQTTISRLQELVRKSDGFKNNRSALEAKIVKIMHDCKEELKKKAVIQNNINRFNQLKEKMKLQEEKIDGLKRITINIPELEQKFSATVTECLQKTVDLQKQKILILKKIQDAMAGKKYTEMELLLFNQQHDHLRNEISEVQEALKNTEDLIQTITRSRDVTKQKHKQKLVEAKQLTNNVLPNDNRYPHKVLYHSLPDSKEEINEQINEYQARIECMGAEDKEVTTEYNQKIQEINVLKDAINDEVHGDSTMKVQIDTIYQNWYPEVDRIISSLNTQFSNFMKSMDFVGEVLLYRKAEYEFDTYGIQIMVQYRSNVPLKALDRNVQSGGERAVAIAVYTLSMQHLTHVPFRCVDEINQGMDPRNERIVFNMLVNETTKEGSSQYFFVTPKLLHNLNYNERMSVHIVFNGAMVQSKCF